MILKISADGCLTGIVGSLKEEMPIDLESLGAYTIKRQGVLTEINGEWFADMFLTGTSVVLGPYASREQAIQGEINWLQANRF